MAQQTLAVKYRPKTFDDVSEQTEVKTILTNQLKNGEIKNAYLFTGGAGTGKTTLARILANQINQGHGNPIELDAASNNSVDDVREIIQQARTKSLESEYKIFILDEVHALSNNAWQAMLKLLEEPPAKSIFIMCTTNPEKIPKTILSRVQRYNFQRISQRGIVVRLEYILGCELNINNALDYMTTLPLDYVTALEYIAKVADGGMRDAITMLDKCLSYSNEVTLENVIKALGLVDYDVMFELTDAMIKKDSKGAVDVVQKIHSSGKDLKTFMKSYMSFILDLCKYNITKSFNYVQIPNTFDLKRYNECSEYLKSLLSKLVRLNEMIKWETYPKSMIEAMIILDCSRED